MRSGIHLGSANHIKCSAIINHILLFAIIHCQNLNCNHSTLPVSMYCKFMHVEVALCLKYYCVYTRV